MQLRSGKRKLDAYQPTFDPNLDIATVVFSHVQCVATRLRLATVSKVWRDASKLAAGYPRRFDFSVVPSGFRVKPFTWSRLALAAYYGHLPALQWLHEIGCPLDEEALYYASWTGAWDCLRYLVDNKCPGWKHFAESYAHRLT